MSKLGKTKSAYSRREVQLSVGLARRPWWARGSAADEAPIFARRDGTALDRSYCYRVVKAAGERAELPSVGLHTLRHRAATLAFRHGWNGAARVCPSYCSGRSL